MKTICDTHVLIFWSQAPKKLTRFARVRLDAGIAEESLACSDISFWEIALLFARERLVKPVEPAQFMRDLVVGMRLSVLPITPEIAALSQHNIFPHRDPADRLIAATAIIHRLPLLTADRKLKAVENLKILW